MKKKLKFLFITMLMGVAFSMVACKGSSDDGTSGDGSGNTYTVTFDADYRSNNTSTKTRVTVASGATVSKPETDPPLSSHKFIGWSSSNYSYVPYDFNTPVTSNIRLYAVYDAKLQEIYLNKATGYVTNNGYVCFETISGSPFTFTTNALNGIEVYAKKDGGTKTKVNSTFESRYSAYVYLYSFDPVQEIGEYTIYVNNGFGTEISQHISVEYLSYRVVFETNGGQNYSPIVVGSTDESVYYINLPTYRELTRSGYKLVGWYTDSALTNQVTLNAEGKFHVTSNCTLYAKWEVANKVTFDKDYRSTVASSKSFDLVSPGSTVAQPANPSLEDHTFVGWSTSKASYIPYDFSTSVTSDITLYAVYSAKLDRIDSTKDDLETSNGTVCFETTASNPFIFVDGSLYGLEVYLEKTSSPAGEKTLVQSSYDKIGNRIYYIQYNFTPQTVPGTYKVYVKANNEISLSDAFTVEPPAPVTNLTLSKDDSYIKATFTPAPSYTRYEATCSAGGTVVATKNITLSKTATSGNVEFFGLTNGTSYTVAVKTAGTDKVASETITPSFTKKTSTNLLIMYMDGDNNLVDPIFEDVNEVELGLYRIRNSDGTAKTGYQDVNVVVLWDGCASYVSDGVTRTAKLGIPGSAIFELASDGTTLGSLISQYQLSSETKNLSYTAGSWLMGSNAFNPAVLTKDSSGEVNMSDKQTLINFLTWVNAHYDATNIYLQFSDHGGGPRSKEVTTVNKFNYERALCWDDTSSGNINDCLKSKDVSDALTAAGFGPSKKLAMLLFDVCLGASLEDAYQLRNFADYMVASPNNIPGNGFEYTQFMESFTTGRTVEQIGAQIIEDYKNFYKGKKWNSVASQLNSINNNTSPKPYSSFIVPSAFPGTTSMTQEQVNIMNFFSAGGIPTLTLFKLSKMQDVANAVNDMATTLMSKNDNVTFKSATMTYSKWVQYYYVDFPGWRATGWTFWYEGTFGWLNDVAYMANNIKEMASNTTFQNETNPFVDATVAAKANAVVNACKAAIVSSYRECLVKEGNQVYIVFLTQANGYGMTVAGGQFAGKNAAGQTILNCPTWYRNELDFGNGAWGQLLTSWYGQ